MKAPAIPITIDLNKVGILIDPASPKTITPASPDAIDAWLFKIGI